MNVDKELLLLLGEREVYLIGNEEMKDSFHQNETFMHIHGGKRKKLQKYISERDFIRILN